jgi:hypothetical protein
MSWPLLGLLSLTKLIIIILLSCVCYLLFYVAGFKTMVPLNLNLVMVAQNTAKIIEPRRRCRVYNYNYNYKSDEME